MTDDELSQFLTSAAAIYYDRLYLKMSEFALKEAIDKLSAPGVLPSRAIAAIVDQPVATVERLLPKERRRSGMRGALNPQHIPTLGYMLSFKRQYNHEVAYMIEHGTSIGMIAALTNMSKATIHRWRNE